MPAVNLTIVNERNRFHAWSYAMRVWRLLLLDKIRLCFTYSDCINFMHTALGDSAQAPAGEHAGAHSTQWHLQASMQVYTVHSGTCRRTCRCTQYTVAPAGEHACSFFGMLRPNLFAPGACRWTCCGQTHLAPIMSLAGATATALTRPHPTTAHHMPW